jgi:predicted phosphatase
MKGKYDFVGIKVSIDQKKKTLTSLEVLFFKQFEAHLGNLKSFFGPILCLYVIFDIS